jgi:hypothetical protein
MASGLPDGDRFDPKLIDLTRINQVLQETA